MIEIETEVKKWGNSLAIVLPRNKIKGVKIKPGKKLTILIPKESVNLNKEFGSLKKVLKKSTKEIMRIVDEGWD